MPPSDEDKRAGRAASLEDGQPPRIVIIGGGFGGLAAARALTRTRASITLIDRQNHHCFQPLLYQVASATLNPADVAWPIRSLLASQRNATVLTAEVTGIDTAQSVVQTDGGIFPYDHLVVATGATHAYFGRDEWARHAPGLKRIEDAIEIRRRILLAFEHAEITTDADEKCALSTFVVIGGGPTGVEMAGAIADMAQHALARDFRNIDPAAARIILIEAAPRLLAAFPEELGDYTRRALEKRGVEVRTGARVTAIEDGVVKVGDATIVAGAIVWAAGVAASAAADWLKAEHDRAGRVRVNADLTLPDHPDIFVIGDTAAVLGADGRPVPGIAPAAKQMGRFAGELIAARIGGRVTQTRFVYRHEGNLATIGRKAAVVDLGRIKLTGLIGWLFWGLVHVYFLIGARSRIAVTFNWLWDYVTFGRRARLITHPSTTPLGGALAARPTVDAAAAAGDSAGSSTRSAEASWR
ncbi:FAD-dependent oxidoreductase [Sphingomonas spermidinifaciens]|uniref:NADH:ubiquinone reductase (non-electrogenic) n=1 Tax=Sphingomonas spermidinifaciens TaxID=1141889 RepID=A0A2A4B1Y6_9SPHN|nr:NAD(P)/FAD-dependent oxidoreductase [Sphingomonas spermidinifaciens]PCD01799.1 FAD-dependent oxidoreductase [Sphingomonas spermidinifaciens]